MLDKLLEENCANFAHVCKSISECGSAMRGGADNGDLGWLDGVVFTFASDSELSEQRLNTHHPTERQTVFMCFHAARTKQRRQRWQKPKASQVAQNLSFG